MYAGTRTILFKQKLDIFSVIGLFFRSEMRTVHFNIGYTRTTNVKQNTYISLRSQIVVLDCTPIVSYSWFAMKHRIYRVKLKISYLFSQFLEFPLLSIYIRSSPSKVMSRSATGMNSNCIKMLIKEKSENIKVYWWIRKF